MGGYKEGTKEYEERLKRSNPYLYMRYKSEAHTEEGRRFWVWGTYDPSKKQKKHYYEPPKLENIFYHHYDPATGRHWITKKYTCPATIIGWSTWENAKIRPFTQEALEIELPPTPEEMREKWNIRKKFNLGEYRHPAPCTKKEATTRLSNVGGCEGARCFYVFGGRPTTDVVTDTPAWAEGLEWVDDPSVPGGGYYREPGGAAVTDTVVINPEMEKLAEHVPEEVAPEEVSIYGYEAAKAAVESEYGVPVYPFWREKGESTQKKALNHIIYTLFGKYPHEEEYSKYEPIYTTKKGEIVQYERPTPGIPGEIESHLPGIPDVSFPEVPDVFSSGFGGVAGTESGGMSTLSKIGLGIFALAAIFILAKSAPELAKARAISKKKRG